MTQAMNPSWSISIDGETNRLVLKIETFEVQLDRQVAEMIGRALVAKAQDAGTSDRGPANDAA